MSGIGDWIDDLRHSMIGQERKVVIGTAGTVALVVAVTLGWWWMASRWTPPPSIFDSPVDDVLGYLAMDDFNQLSVEERMRYLGEFASRFRGFQQEESASAAAFLAGVTGPTREQMRQNARTLAKDVLLEGAEGYLATPEDERGRFIDDWLADWQRRAEEMVRGEARPIDDATRAAEIRAEAKEDMMRDRDPDEMPALDDRMTSRFLGFWRSDIESASSPREQGQIIRFMEDIRVHLALTE
ncbi:MAG: hypothetical protein GY895_15655 [Phycisphaera sp.]|nr:hypothetical protein [Phycisphaera sp.]